LFDEHRQQDGGSLGIIRELLMQEYKDLSVIDADDYKNIKLDAAKHYGRDL
jgi:hypothetical protein